MKDNSDPEVELTSFSDVSEAAATDRLDKIETLLQKPRAHFKKYERPTPHEWENSVLPIIQAVELLAAEVRTLRDRRP